MTKTAKLDLYKEFKADYAAAKSPKILTIAPARYLAIDGKGEPGGAEFSAKVGALYAMAFTLKMKRKFAGLGDYAVCKLEGLWPKECLTLPREKWTWTLIIRTPDFIKPRELKDTAAALVDKGKGADVKNVRLDTIKEGLCVQMLHVGPYAREEETMKRMEDFASEQGYRFRGPHHEIYLSDPRRVAQEKLRTILRMPL